MLIFHDLNRSCYRHLIMWQGLPRNIRQNDSIYPPNYALSKGIFVIMPPLDTKSLKTIAPPRILDILEYCHLFMFFSSFL